MQNSVVNSNQKFLIGNFIIYSLAIITFSFVANSVYNKPLYNTKYFTEEIIDDFNDTELSFIEAQRKNIERITLNISQINNNSLFTDNKIKLSKDKENMEEDNFNKKLQKRLRFLKFFCLVISKIYSLIISLNALRLFLLELFYMTDDETEIRKITLLISICLLITFIFLIIYVSPILCGKLVVYHYKELNFTYDQREQIYMDTLLIIILLSVFSLWEIIYSLYLSFYLYRNLNSLDNIIFTKPSTPLNLTTVDI